MMILRRLSDWALDTQLERGYWERRLKNTEINISFLDTLRKEMGYSSYISLDYVDYKFWKRTMRQKSLALSNLEHLDEKETKNA